MGRNKGSLNKPKSTTLKVLNFDRQIEGAPINKDSNMGYIKWGKNNNYPDLLLDLYNQSPTHHSCIKFGVQAIVGDGVDYDAMKVDRTQLIPNYTETWDNFIRNISLDFMLYKSFAIEIIRNKDGKTYSFYHIPLFKVRWSPYDEDGQIPFYFICSDWTKVNTVGVTKIRAFDQTTEIKSGEPYLYVYRSYSPTTEYYTEPDYIAGLKAIQAEIEHINYDLKTTLNSFVPSGMLVLPEQETDEQKQEIIKEVSRLFQGSDNANSLLITFRNNVEENKPEFVPFATNTTNVNLYDAANVRTQSRILASHQISDEGLIGLPSIRSTGFSSQAAKLKNAFAVYLKLVGNDNRNVIIGTVNHMLKMNGVEQELIMKPYDFDIDDEKEDVEPVNKEQQDTPEVEEPKENNIEEKVE